MTHAAEQLQFAFLSSPHYVRESEAVRTGSVMEYVHSHQPCLDEFQHICSIVVYTESLCNELGYIKSDHKNNTALNTALKLSQGGSGSMSRHTGFRVNLHFKLVVCHQRHNVKRPASAQKNHHTSMAKRLSSSSQHMPGGRRLLKATNA